ncbi:hypothetical protein TrLO_g6959 [Triparma laevis f. longispina]|uniref:NIPSNAP domain-containing protein n=1 Tax=Triparma laevis f. longispina TaxID=1714387 RepID=A0A9W7ALG2_9STRA|nr:hypothetical protein TrLO_g6959 [Triparma laevis f. longispina]
MLATSLCSRSTPLLRKSLSTARSSLKSHRGFASSSSSPGIYGTYSSSSPGIYEYRHYQLYPASVNAYVAMATESSDLRKSLVPLRLFSLPETGGDLNIASHLYYYEGGMEERDAKRKVSGGSDRWKKFVADSRVHVLAQKSLIYTEAPSSVLEAGDSKGGVWDGSSVTSSPDVCYEIRKYQLGLGYDAVPDFLDVFSEGLQHKVKCQDEETQLATVMYSEVGRLNEVIEIWRHGNGVAGMAKSREMAREAPQWREAIKDMATKAEKFENVIVKPVGFSTWK